MTHSTFHFTLGHVPQHVCASCPPRRDVEWSRRRGARRLDWVVELSAAETAHHCAARRAQYCSSASPRRAVSSRHPPLCGRGAAARGGGGGGCAPLARLDLRALRLPSDILRGCGGVDAGGEAGGGGGGGGACEWRETRPGWTPRFMFSCAAARRSQFSPVSQRGAPPVGQVVRIRGRGRGGGRRRRRAHGGDSLSRRTR
jgi:hypothetical protein